MSANVMHLTEWIVAIVQVTPSHLNECSSDLTTWPSATDDLEVLTHFADFEGTWSGD